MPGSNISDTNDFTVALTGLVLDPSEPTKLKMVGSTGAENGRSFIFKEW